MASITTPGVDVGALTGELRSEFARRFSTVLSSGFQSLEDGGNGLNELQKAAILEWSLEMFDGLEREIASLLIHDLTRDGVEIWGLPKELADLLPGENDA
jgi:hypothetical protein